MAAPLADRTRHDLRNHLATIRGYAALLLEAVAGETGSTPMLIGDFVAIRQAAEAAIALLDPPGEAEAIPAHVKTSKGGLPLP